MYQNNSRKSKLSKSQSQLHISSRRTLETTIIKGSKLRGDSNTKSKPTLKASPKRQMNSSQIVSSFLSEALRKLEYTNKPGRKPLEKSQKKIRRGKTLDKSKHKKQTHDKKISQVASILESLLSQQTTKKRIKKRKAAKSQKINSEDAVKMEIAALKIQEWFRRLLNKPSFTIELKTPCLNLCISESEDDTETIDENVEESKLVEHFRKLLHEKQREIEDKYEVKESSSNTQIVEPEIESVIPVDVPEIEYCTVKGGLQIPKLKLSIEELVYEDSASSLDPDQDLENEESVEIKNYNSALDSDSCSFHQYSDESMAEVPSFALLNPPQECSDLSSEEEEPYFLASSSEDSIDILGSFQKSFAEEYHIEETIQIEINNFLGLVGFELTSQNVIPEFSFVKDCLDHLQDLLKKDTETFLDNFNTPLYIDPEEKLLELKKDEIEIQIPKFELILHPVAIERTKEAFNKEDMYNRSCYLQMIFDCVNEALNYVRPYATQGLPMPWSLKSPQIQGECSIETVFLSIENILKKWDGIKLGKNDTEYELEEALSNMLFLELIEDDYEDQEAQVSIRTADLVFESLVEELIFILN